MGGPVANCPAGGMHMQTCKHAGMKKTKKAKVKRPKNEGKKTKKAKVTTMPPPGFETRTLELQCSATTN